MSSYQGLQGNQQEEIMEQFIARVADEWQLSKDKTNRLKDLTMKGIYKEDPSLLESMFLDDFEDEIEQITSLETSMDLPMDEEERSSAAVGFSEHTQTEQALEGMVGSTSPAMDEDEIEPMGPSQPQEVMQLEDLILKEACKCAKTITDCGGSDLEDQSLEKEAHHETTPLQLSSKQHIGKS